MSIEELSKEEFYLMMECLAISKKLGIRLSQTEYLRLCVEQHRPYKDYLMSEHAKLKKLDAFLES